MQNDLVILLGIVIGICVNTYWVWKSKGDTYWKNKVEELEDRLKEEREKGDAKEKVIQHLILKKNQWKNQYMSMLAQKQHIDGRYHEAKLAKAK